MLVTIQRSARSPRRTSRSSLRSGSARTWKPGASRRRASPI